MNVTQVNTVFTVEAIVINKHHVHKELVQECSRRKNNVIQNARRHAKLEPNYTF